MSPDNIKVILERKEQEANATRMKAWRRRFFQVALREDFEVLVALRELRVGRES